MIRYAPAATPTSAIPPTKATARTPASSKASMETPAIETLDVIEERKPAGEGDLLLAELPEVSAPAKKATKPRAPRKSKAELVGATAAQLDLSA